MLRGRHFVYVQRRRGMCHDINEFRGNGFKRHGLTLELSKNAVYAGESFFGMITFNHCDNDNRPTFNETLFNTEHASRSADSTSWLATTRWPTSCSALPAVSRRVGCGDSARG